MKKIIHRCIIFMLILSLNIVIYLALQMNREESTRRYRSNRFCDQCNFIPKDDAPSNHLLCLIVPFRDRFEELLIFAPEIRRFLRSKNISHKILIMNQIDNFRFNRASLINVGYFESIDNGCDYLCMHDIDLLPLNIDLDYRYPDNGHVYHVAAPEYHPKYHYEKFIGGILILNLIDYRSINGMSNKYWGWGLEDDEFYLRIIDGKLNIDRPKNLSTDSITTFRHVHDKKLRKRDTLRVGNQKKESRKRDRQTGLNDVEYLVDSRTSMQIGDASVIVINVKLNCNKTFTPWCELPQRDNL